jgi:phage-related holin
MKKINALIFPYKEVILQYLVFFFAPIGYLIAGVGLMVCFDFISGVAAAKKRGERIVSGGFYRTFVKYVLYTIGIVASRLLELLLKDSIKIPFSSLLAGFIIIIEYKSVIENISFVTGINIWEWVKDKISDIHPKKNKK